MSRSRRKRPISDSLFLDLQLDNEESGTPEGARLTNLEPQVTDGDPTTPEEAVRWLELNIDSVRVSSSSLPYSQEDFLQEAYYSALEAFAVAQRKKISFEACFRKIFSRHIHNLRGVSVFSTRLDDVEFLCGTEAEVTGNIVNYNVITENEVGRVENFREELIQRAMQQMTPTQREVWDFILTHRASLRETSDALGKDYRVISKIFKAGIKYIREIYADIDLEEEFLGYMSTK